MYSKNIHFETMASNESIKRAVPLSSIKRGNTTREMDKNKKKKKEKDKKSHSSTSEHELHLSKKRTPMYKRNVAKEEGKIVNTTC